MQSFAARSLQMSSMSAYLTDFLRPGQDINAVDFFVYNGIGTDSTVNFFFIETQSDSDFVLVAIAGSTGPILDSGGPFVLFGGPLQITDTGSGKTFFSEPTPAWMVTGFNGIPFVLPTPRLLMPNTTLRVDVEYGYTLSLIGLRLYYSAPDTAVSTALANT